MWLTPTLALYGRIVEQWGRPAAIDAFFLEDPLVRYLSPEIRVRWQEGNPYTRRTWPPNPDPEEMRESFEFLRKLTVSLHEAGARLLLGTDAPVPTMVPGFSIHEEISALVDAGVDPLAVLRAGTCAAGEYIAERIDGDAHIGKVAEGHRADLVLLDGDPLDNVRNLKRIAGVMVHGRWLPRSELTELLDAVAAHAGRSPISLGVPVDRQRLEACTGTFAAENAPVSPVVFGLDDEGLYARVPDGTTYRLVPLSSSKFHIVGLGEVEFVPIDERPVEVRVIDGTTVMFALERRE